MTTKEQMKPTSRQGDFCRIQYSDRSDLQKKSRKKSSIVRTSIKLGRSTEIEQSVSKFKIDSVIASNPT